MQTQNFNKRNEKNSTNNVTSRKRDNNRRKRI